MKRNNEFCDRDYPIQESMQLQRRLWLVERLGWGTFLLIVSLALLGLFSQGVLSGTTEQSADADLIVTYQRFERSSAASEISIQAQGDAHGMILLEITGDLMDKFTVEGIQPEPLTSDSFRDGLRLAFRADQAGSATVHFAVRPEGLGLSRSKFAIAGSPAVAVDQFIYP